MKGNLQRKESLLAKYLKNYRERFSRKDASQLLNSMATSKDILFWTPKVEMLYEYSQTRRVYSSNLQPRCGKPITLNTFLDGIAKIGINKRLVRKKNSS